MTVTYSETYLKDKLSKELEASYVVSTRQIPCFEVSKGLNITSKSCYRFAKGLCHISEISY